MSNTARIESLTIAIKLSIAAQANKLRTDLGDEFIYTATLTGLKPGTRYYYMVGDGTKNSSSVFSFKTEEENSDHFQFMVFGDTQSGVYKKPDYDLWQSTIHNAYNANPDAKFLIVMGDAVQAGQSNAHWNNWFAAAKGIIESISYMPVEGNHEYSELDRHKVVPTLYKGQFKVPNSGPYNDSQAYSFDYGNAHFTVLSSQFRENNTLQPNLLNDETVWLEKDLGQTKKKWKVVLWHKAPYSTRHSRTNEMIKAAFPPILDKYHVDIAFNAHDHAYSRTYPINNDQIVSSPASGTVYITAGRSGAKFYNDSAPNIWDANFFDPQDMPNYIVADVNGSRMEIKTYKMDGTLVDDYIIDKTSGDTPRTAVPPKYAKPRLAVNGILLNKPLMPTSPSQISGKWYFPIKPVVEFLGGSESVSDNNMTLSLIVENYLDPGVIWSDREVHTVVLINASINATLDNASIYLPDSVVVDDDENFLISADDMYKLFGFAWKYDSDRNILLLINPSRPGE